jgi:iron(III) transport system substrate-binding protein
MVLFKGKKLALLTALAVLLVLFAGCKGKSAQAAGQSAGQAAGPSGPTGKIVIYTSMYEDIIEALDKALDKQFPNCDISFFYGGTGALQAKIAAERDAGKLGCDMLMVAEPAYSLELLENGMLHPYKSSQAANLAFDYDKDGYWYPVRISNMVLAYNPDKFAKNSIPNSLYDFAYSANVKGAVSMSNPLTSGTAMAAVTALKDKYGYEYFTALSNQGVMIESGSVALTKLETGECKVIMILEESVLKKREEEKSKLEVIYPTDGTIVVPSTIMTVNEKWNANNSIPAAEVITDWFLSPEGQANIVAAWMHSPRAGFPTMPYDAIPTTQIKANSMPVDWDHCYRQREEIRTKFEEAVTRKK